MQSAKEFQETYRRTVLAFRRALPDPGLRLHFRPDEDLRAHLLWHWKSLGIILTPDHALYYNALQSEVQEEVLFWDLVSRTDHALAPPEPAFLPRLRRGDERSGTRNAAKYQALRQDILDQFDALLPIQEHQVPSPRPAVQGGEEVRVGVPEPEPDVPPLDALLAELDALYGLESVKREVRSLINLVRVRQLRAAAELPVPPMSLHMVFLGNPGTGKTTVARLIGKLYRAIGVLSKGQLVEVERADLVAGYTGQTALKTRAVLDRALGGVLFLDEAYALAPERGEQDFGREAVEVLLRAMEDHREDLVVIAAGYPGPMERFLRSNPGLQSRFAKTLTFEDYDVPALLAILQGLCEKNGYTLTPAARDRAAERLQERCAVRDERFGNAREVRNLFEQAAARQADRLAAWEAPSREALMTLEAEDLA